MRWPERLLADPAGRAGHWRCSQRLAQLPPSLLAAGLLLCATAIAQPRDGVADALAGHQAEMNQLSGMDPMRRAFFFDPVAVEGPNPGVPCDHLRRRRPEVIAGEGRVVLLESAQDSTRRLRYWLSPDFGQPADPVAAAAAYAKSAGFEPFRLLGVRDFAWCR